MSLKKKIILGFLISATIIAIPAVAGYINFIEIRKEIGRESTPEHHALSDVVTIVDIF